MLCAHWPIRSPLSCNQNVTRGEGPSRGFPVNSGYCWPLRGYPVPRPRRLSKKSPHDTTSGCCFNNARRWRSVIPPQTPNSRRPPDCQERLARRPELAPLAQKVYLAHPSVHPSALFDIQSVATVAERPLLLKWLAGRRSCEPEIAKIKDAANWSVKARRADDLAAQITNDMIVQLAEGKMTYGQFNRQRAMNAVAVDKIP